MTGEDGPAATPAIPVRNLYRMLLYAWQLADVADPAWVDEESPSSLGELLAAVLCRHMDQVIRRGLDQDYVEREDVLPTIRGQLLLKPTVLRRLDQRGRAACRFDERSPDIPVNQLVKATAGLILRAQPMDRSLRDRLHLLRQRLGEVSDVRADERLLGQVRLHRNNRRYRVAVSVCRFVIRQLAMDEQSGRLGFDGFLRSEERMRALFEKFVLGFCRVELRGNPGGPTAVTPRRYRWSAEPPSPDDPAGGLVPALNTDVNMEWPDHTRIIECKYTQSVIVGGPHGSPMLKPEYLRQLYAYCRAAAEGRGTRPPMEGRVDGILLHAQPAGEPVAVDVRLGGIRVRVRTLDLGWEWTELKGSLLATLRGSR